MQAKSLVGFSAMYKYDKLEQKESKMLWILGIAIGIIWGFGQMYFDEKYHQIREDQNKEPFSTFFIISFKGGVYDHFDISRCHACYVCGRGIFLSMR